MHDYDEDFPAKFLGVPDSPPAIGLLKCNWFSKTVSESRTLQTQLRRRVLVFKVPNISLTIETRCPSDSLEVLDSFYKLQMGGTNERLVVPNH